MAFNLADVLKDVPKLGTEREHIEYISLDLIESDPNNFYQLSDIENLAANIALCGLQQPIRVRPIPGADNYRIVSGHRRRAALEELRKDDPERWNEAPCIVEQDEASPALQQLRLIYANANTRTMTSAELSEQAVQVEKLLYQLKEDGYEFPGRMRDHVAQAVGQSKSKLARLKVIRDNLSNLWRPSWDIEDLSESTAYEIAKLSKDLQNLLFAEKQRTGAKIKYLYADDVKRYAERARVIANQSCSFNNCKCENYENKVCKAAVADRYGWFHCSEKCCKDCPELIRCKSSCPKLADKVAALRSDAKAKAREEKELRAAKDAPVIDQISQLWQRFGIARNAAEKSVEDVKNVLGYLLPNDNELAILERGEGKLTTSTRLPFAHYLSEITKIIQLADLFCCSVDYLFCRTDVPEMNTLSNAMPQVAASGNGWQTGNPVEYGTYVACIQLSEGTPKRVRELVWTGDEWLLYGEKLADGKTVRSWIRLPE